MANIDKRPGVAWKGLNTNNAPQNSDPGFLIDADETIIRMPTSLEQRRGFYKVAERESSIKDWPCVGMYDLGDSNIIQVVQDKTNLFHQILDQTDKDGVKDVFDRVNRNYWGYTHYSAKAASETSAIPGGMVWSDTQVVNDIYVTQNGPGKFITSKLMTSAAYITSDTATDYVVRSVPLGTPAASQITSIALQDYNPTGMFDLTPIYFSNTTVNTFAYRTVYKLNEAYGSPSQPYIVTTSVLPDITAGSVTGTVCTFTTASAHGLTTDNVVGIFGSSADRLLRGVYPITVVSTTQFSIIVSSGLTVASPSTIEWRRYKTASLQSTLPKECFYDGSRLCTTLDIAAFDEVGDYNTSVAFQGGQLELYRTKITTSTPEVGAVDPGNELFLVSKSQWVNDPVYGYIQAQSDRLPDEQLGDFLYTNSSQFGIQGAKQRPPVARVHEVYQNYHFWANIKEHALLMIDIRDRLASNFAIRWRGTNPTGDVGQAIDFVLKPNVGSSVSNFGTLSFGTPSTGNLAADIQQMGLNICWVINNNANVPLKASYISGFSDSQGKILITGLDHHTQDLSLYSNELVTKIECSLNASPVTDFTFTSPKFPVDAPSLGTGLKVVTATADRKTNRIYWSAFQEAAACPAVNFIDLPEDREIIGLRTTSQGLFVVTDSGIWYLTGTSEGNWLLQIKDKSANAWAQGAITVNNDLLYVLTENGVQTYGNGENISYPINDYLLPLHQQSGKKLNLMWDLTNTASVITAIADPLYGEYILILSDNGKRTIRRYNKVTKAWTSSERRFSAGTFERSSDYSALVFWDEDFQHMVMERAKWDPLKNSDEDFNVVDSQIISQTALPNGTVRGVGVLLPVGLAANHLIQANDYIALIHYDPANTNVVTTISWVQIIDYKADGDRFVWHTNKVIPHQDEVTECSVVITIRSNIIFNPLKGDDPTINKRWGRVFVNLWQNGVRELDLSIQTDEHRQVTTVDLQTINAEDGWGFHPWGEFAWGNDITNSQPVLTTYVPPHQAVGRILTVSLRNTGFNQDLRIQGINAEFTDLSRRTK